MKTLNLSYLQFLTDSFSIWQHSKGIEIDRAKGYALDDAARALLVALQYSDLNLAKTYLNFLETACCSYEEPVNFFDAKRQPVNHPISPDALGEAYWAVASCIQQGFAVEQAQRVALLLKSHLENMHHLRTYAYTLLGAVIVDEQFAQTLTEHLLSSYKKHATASWPWSEVTLTYANAIVPLALLAAAEAFQKHECQEVATTMLNFLNEVCKHNEKPMAIGNEGWYERGGTKTLHSQQPIDPAYQVLANMKAYELTKEVEYKKEADLYLSWFWGNNSANEALIDAERNRCLDGIDQHGVSINAGAESTVCYLLAQATGATC